MHGVQPPDLEAAVARMVPYFEAGRHIVDQGWQPPAGGHAGAYLGLHPWVVGGVVPLHTPVH